MKAAIARGLRQAGLLGLAEGVLTRIEVVRGYGQRQRFRRAHPDFPLPPTDLAYDAFGAWDADMYRRQGRAHAGYIADMIRAHHPAPGIIAEWGCGPMRVLRHMPAEFPHARLVGLDYNPRSIAWCKATFPAISFYTNALQPPLPLADASVDAIYAISVFTHLSEQSHEAYAKDLMRCLAPGGILVVTLHGDSYIPKLTAEERATFQRGALVVRAGVTEGTRTYVAFHSPDYVRRLFASHRIVAHNPTSTVERFTQDTWVIAK